MTERRPALLLLHAFGAAGRSFAPLADRLAGWDVHAPDLPGSSGAPPLPRPTVGAYADWVEEFVHSKGLTRVVVGGWSMGGKIALALAVRQPEWLRTLLLIAPSPLGPEPMDEDDRCAQLAGYGDPALARRSVTSLMVAKPPADWLDTAIEDRLAVCEPTWRWWLEEGSRENLTPSQPIETLGLVLVGSGDSNLGIDVQRRLTMPLLAHAELQTVADCGHFLPLEQTDALARRVVDLLARS